MRKTLVATACSMIAVVLFAGCSDPEIKGTPIQSGESSAVSSLKEVPEIASIVPESTKKDGILDNGASTDFPPAEFIASDGQTPIGYEVDLVKALATVMGFKNGVTHNDEFPKIIPGLGSKFDIGASSFTITPEREKEVKLVSYLKVGLAYAVAAGNPSKFNPENPCGATVGVQDGTASQDLLKKISSDCVSQGKPDIKIMPLTLQPDVFTKVAGRQYDATLADSPVISYALKQQGTSFEQAGDIIDVSLQGIAVSKDNEKLAEAVQKALQYLIDNGYMEKLLAPYGLQSFILPKVEINPTITTN